MFFLERSQSSWFIQHVPWSDRLPWCLWGSNTNAEKRKHTLDDDMPPLNVSLSLSILYNRSRKHTHCTSIFCVLWIPHRHPRPPSRPLPSVLLIIMPQDATVDANQRRPDKQWLPVSLAVWFTAASAGRCAVQRDQSVTAHNTAHVCCCFWLYLLQSAAGSNGSVLIWASKKFRRFMALEFLIVSGAFISCLFIIVSQNSHQVQELQYDSVDSGGAKGHKSWCKYTHNGWYPGSIFLWKDI